MQFLYPAFLWALAAIAIPIILHLFHFRRFKKVYFTNVRFLREVKEEKSARSKLRNLLVLLMRLLAIIALVLAFAQPFIPTNQEVKQGIKAVSVYVDNSFSMSALSQDVPLLEKAKQRAREIVAAFGPEDRFQVLSNDFAGRQQRLVGRDDALALIDELTISPAARPLSQVINRQQQALQSAKTDNQIIYQISDFQRTTTDLDNYQDSTIQLNLIPLQAVQERNIGIDSAWFDAPVRMLNQTNPLFVRITNYSDQDADNIRLSLTYGGQEKPVGTLSVPARGSVIDTVNFTILSTGWQEAELALTDYPVQFDDKYYFSFQVATQIKVLAIHEAAPNRFLQAALNGIPAFQLTSLNSQQLDYAGLGDYQLLILDDLTEVSSGLSFALKEYVAGGGNVLVFPKANANVNSYRAFLESIPASSLQRFETQERAVGEVNTQEFVFRDVFDNRSANLRLPTTVGNFRLSRNAQRGEEILLSYRDGSPYLAKYTSGRGNLYLCAAPLNTASNNLVNNGEIFVPMLYKMAISAGGDPRIAYTIGRDEVLQADHRVSATEMVYKLRSRVGEFIPEQRIVGNTVFLGLNNQIQEAGYYQLFRDAKEILQEYAFNFNRQESALDYYTPADLQERVGPLAAIMSVGDNAVLTAQIEEQSQGIALWRWCLMLALVFLGVETLLLRFWKV